MLLLAQPAPASINVRRETGKATVHRCTKNESRRLLARVEGRRTFQPGDALAVIVKLEFDLLEPAFNAVKPLHRKYTRRAVPRRPLSPLKCRRLRLPVLRKVNKLAHSALPHRCWPPIFMPVGEPEARACLTIEYLCPLAPAAYQ